MMGPTIARTMAAAVFLLGVFLAQLLPGPNGRPRRDAYTPFDRQSVHRRGCLDPEARARDSEVDVIRLSVEHETALLVTMFGSDGLMPGFVVTADDGAAAAHGWMREVGAREAPSLAAPVVLPAAGAYTFIIADRRELTGDEMAAGHGCFSADLQPTALPPAQTLPYVWRGTVGAPVAFSVPRRGRDLTLVEVTNVVDHGVLLVSFFENNAYLRSLTILPKESTRMLVSSHAKPARILVEEATNWGSEPLRAMVRSVPEAFAPDAGAEDEQRVAAAPDDGVL